MGRKDTAEVKDCSTPECPCCPSSSYNPLVVSDSSAPSGSPAPPDRPSSAAAADLLIGALRDLAATQALDSITRIVRTTARRLAGADGATFVLRDGEHCHYVDEEAIAPLWKGRRFPLKSCISGWAMRYRQQVVIPDIYEDARIPHDAYRPTFVRSLVMTPVRALQPWAAIGVYWAGYRVPTPDEANWLQALADSTAVAMEKVRVESELHGGDTVDGPPAPPVRMCAWTKRLALDGEWVSIEAYLKRRFGLDVTHGISDEALAAMTDEVLRHKDAAAPGSGPAL